MLNYNNSNKWNEALGYENVGKYYKLESNEWNRRQACSEAVECVERKAQLVPTPEYVGGLALVSAWESVSRWDHTFLFIKSFAIIISFLCFFKIVVWSMVLV